MASSPPGTIQTPPAVLLPSEQEKDVWYRLFNCAKQQYLDFGVTIKRSYDYCCIDALWKISQLPINTYGRICERFKNSLLDCLKEPVLLGRSLNKIFGDETIKLHP